MAHHLQRRVILGLTGSIGSGKSFVTACFEDLGTPAIRADELAREVVLPGGPAYREIIQHFGNEVCRPDGHIDRRRLADVVFNSPGQRRVLEQIIHPRVRQREEELIAEYPDKPLVVLDIPLLYESGAETLCDKVLVVTINEEERRERLRRDRGLSDADIDARLAAQMSQEEKVRRADHVIDNSGTREQTRELVRQLFDRLVHPG